VIENFNDAVIHMYYKPHSFQQRFTFLENVIFNQHNIIHFILLLHIDDGPHVVAGLPSLQHCEAQKVAKRDSNANIMLCRML
jgi:hypothetical protein